MDRISFETSAGTETLRPTHARLVATALGAALEDAPDGALAVDAPTLATAAWTTRDGYRCRTVRTELRRLALAAAQGGGMVRVTCAEAAEIAAMREARAA